jgi:hypothetical protein
MSKNIKLDILYGCAVVRPEVCAKIITKQAPLWKRIYYTVLDAIIPPLLFALSFTFLMIAFSIIIKSIG